MPAATETKWNGSTRHHMHPPPYSSTAFNNPSFPFSPPSPLLSSFPHTDNRPPARAPHATTFPTIAAPHPPRPISRPSARRFRPCAQIQWTRDASTPGQVFTPAEVPQPTTAMVEAMEHSYAFHQHTRSMSCTSHFSHPSYKGDRT